MSDLLCGVAMFAQDSIALDRTLDLGNVTMTGDWEQLFDFLFIFFLLSSNFHIMIIAFERLIAIAVPTSYDTIDREVFRKVSVLAIWLVTAVSAGSIQGITYYKMKSIETKTDRMSCYAFVRQLYGGVMTSLCVIVFTTYIILFVLILR